MNPMDFGLSFFASWLANQTEKLFPKKDQSKETVLPTAERPQQLKEKPLFKTFDVLHDLPEILPNIRKPVFRC